MPFTPIVEWVDSAGELGLGGILQASQTAIYLVQIRWWDIEEDVNTRKT